MFSLPTIDSIPCSLEVRSRSRAHSNSNSASYLYTGGRVGYTNEVMKDLSLDERSWWFDSLLQERWVEWRDVITRVKNKERALSILFHLGTPRCRKKHEYLSRQWVKDRYVVISRLLVFWDHYHCMSILGTCPWGKENYSLLTSVPHVHDFDWLSHCNY